MGNLVPLVFFALASGAIFGVRKRLGLFWSVAAFYVVAIAYVTYGMDPPAPGSIVRMVTLTSLVAVLMYVTSSEASREAFWAPLRSLMVEKSKRPMLGVVLIAVPAVVAWRVFDAVKPSPVPPPKTRSIHPPPPGSVKFKPPTGQGRSIDVIKEESPYAGIKSDNPELYAEKVTLGKKVYYENCYYCHGDNLEADGHYADAVSFPPPANFQDPGVIPMFQNTFWFWRIAKGGPGLPDEGTPWDSAMPVWEKYLTEDEIWAVILFMSDFTGFDARANVEMEH